VLRAGAYVCGFGPGDEIDASVPPLADDADGDGVRNSDDNCPDRENANQDNEDGDAFGDACDNCPPFVSDGADGDGDGVGDLCDPAPAKAGDQLMLFEGFAHGIPSGWTAVGMWSVSNGALVSTATGTDLSTLVVPMVSWPHQTMSSRATITGLTSALGGAIGIVDSFNGTAGVHCGGARVDTGEYLALVDAGNGNVIKRAAHAFDVGTTYNLQFTRRDATYVCSDGATTVSENVNTGGGQQIGFRNRIASASYGWLMVVRSP